MHPTGLVRLLARVSLAVFLCAAGLASAQEAADVGRASSEAGKDAQSFCIFDKQPPSDMKYQPIRALKVAKGSYGGVTDILPKFVNSAIALRADAIIEYNGSQRFGFFPWRMVRPVVSGTAVQWTVPATRSCEAMGGTTLQTILLTNKAPKDVSAPTVPAAEPLAPAASAASS